MKTKLLIILLLICEILNAQTFDLLWSKSNNYTNNDDRARRSALDNTGIYTVGNDYLQGDNQWRIEKRNLYTGDTIWTKTINLSARNDYAQDITVFNSSLYISGYENISGSDYQWRLEKRNSLNGKLIWSQNSNPSSGGDVGFGVCANDSGVFMVGADYVPGKNEWRIERRDLNTGGLIWFKNTDPSSTGSTAQALHIVADDSAIYICGYDGAPGASQWHIEKRDITTGAVIWIQLSNPSSDHDYAQDITMDSSGIYIVGFDDSLSSSDRRWRIEKRNLSTGNIIWVQTNNPSPFKDIANSVTHDSNFLYIGGTQGLTSTDVEWRIEKRNLSDGMLSCSQVSNPSTFSGDDLAGISVDGSGVYVSGHDVIATGDFEWHIEKYSLCSLPKPPVISLTASDDTICVKQYVNFSGNSTNNPIAWNWSFPGGNPSSSTAQNPINICYNISGKYSVKLKVTYIASTDSITKTNYILVNSKPSTPIITENAETLISSSTAGNQWYFNGNIISGATSQSYNPANEGRYTVLVIDTNRCQSDTSNGIQIFNGIKLLLQPNSIKIFPNPNNGAFTINSNSTISSFEVYNLTGELLYSDYNLRNHTSHEIDLSYLNKGIYFARTSDGKGIMIEKLIIQ